MNTNEYLINRLDEMDNDEPMFTQLSPNTKLRPQKMVQHVSVRGIPDSSLKKYARVCPLL